jgi:hypothetical protein
MKRFYRILGITILISLIIQSFTGICIFAADLTQSGPPRQLRVEALNDEPPIGYNEFDKSYIDLKWDSAVFPGGTEGEYLNLYTQEIPKPYRPSTSRILKEKDIPGSSDKYRLNELNSGTIYYIDMTSYYTKTDGTTTFVSLESKPSNKVKVLTDISINAYSYGTNQIKIEWDDVWDKNGRIGYKLYVSENDSFANTQPIYIEDKDIGDGKAVTVNKTNGKLEYTHTVRDAGRVYYVRIQPVIADDEVKRTDYTKTVQASSFILVKTSKVSTTDDGVVWKLQWIPVVTGLSDADIKVVYHIYRGTIGSSSLPEYMAALDGTDFFITMPSGEVRYYYIIRAIVTKNGEDLYKGIKIESDRIIVGEQEAPSRPVAPEIVDLFEKVEGDTIISYDEELSSTSATILWRLPLKGNGDVDTDVEYDIWLITDPNTLDNPPATEKIGADFKVGSQNYVYDDKTLIGYKYSLKGLTPNSTYYFKIVAKKKFLENVDDILQNVTYNSDAALKVIITPSDGPIEQPLVPARPPLKVKKNSDNSVWVTENSVTLQLKNLWYEKFNFDLNKWEYIRSEKLSESDIPPFVPNSTVVDDVYYRKVEYDSGVTLDVGCIKYVEGMDYEDLKKIPADKIKNFPVTANDLMENWLLNPDGKRHNIDINVTGLEPNTAYVIWVRAVRLSANLQSEPSDPIIVTTLPVIDPTVEKPVVPFFNYDLASDNYIYVGWNVVPGYNYHLRYGLEDNPNASVKEITITSEELEESIYYKVSDLTPDTFYYFWVQAEAVNENGVISTSDWSDSYMVKTLKYIPPETPKGFGIKNSVDAITKNSITFEWMKVDGLEYILEVASDVNYSNSTEYSAGNESEYTVKDLLSNHRYYARLYAYDPTKQMRSEATMSITVRTKRSGDDYDSDVDIEDVITGEFIKKGTEIVNDTWIIEIINVNADRFAEHVLTDNKLDYRIDISKPPKACSNVKIIIADKVFKALTSIGENLIIKNNKISLILRPGILTTNSGNPLLAKSSGVNYEIVISSSQEDGDGIKNMTVKEKTGKVTISAYEGANTVPIYEVLKPMQFVMAYSKEDWYNAGKTSGFVYNSDLSLWERASTKASYNRDTGEGKLTFETLKTGDTIIAEIGKDYFDDIYYHNYETAINNVASVHELKSVSGRLFEPDLNATLGDSVKLIFDSLDYQYGSDYMKEAFKTGLISYNEIYSENNNCTASKAYSMLIKLFELKSGTTLSSEKKASFISQNGFTIIRDGKSILQDTVVRRGEIMYLIEKLMVYIGEIE